MMYVDTQTDRTTTVIPSACALRVNDIHTMQHLISPFFLLLHWNGQLTLFGQQESTNGGLHGKKEHEHEGTEKRMNTPYTQVQKQRLWDKSL